MAQPDIAVSPEGEASVSVHMMGSEGMHEFIRYFLASAVALAVDVGLLTFFTSVLGISYLISGALSFLAGLTVAYVLSIYWVFSRRKMRNFLTEFAIFAAIGLVGLAINQIILWFLTSIVGLFYLVSKMASVIVVFSWNFFARKFSLFN